MSAPPAVATPVRMAATTRPALAVLAIGAVLWLLLFHAEAVAAVGVWISSTAYGHCFLVLPVAAWLAWERRAALADMPPRPWPTAALAALPLGAAWFLADRLGVMEGRQLAAVALLLLLFVAVLGARLSRAFAVPLGYLVFLVPFGGFLVGPLQMFTARFIDLGLDLLAIPHVVTRFIIEIPEGTFRVAEACAGLRFLIAAIAFGVVYACTLYRSTGRRVAFIVTSMIVPVVANGIRALGIVLLGHLRGSAEAGAVDHIVYGWLFFSMVIVLLILAGLPFREDAPASSIPGADRAVRPPGGVRATGLAALSMVAAGVLLLSAIAPAAAAMLDAVAAGQQAAMPPDASLAILARLATPAGCTRRAPDWFVCFGVPIAVVAEVFAPRTSAASLIAARRAATSGFDMETASVQDWRQAGQRGPSWEVTTDGVTTRLVATTLSIGAGGDGTGLAFRVHRAVASVVGGDIAAVLIVVTAGRNDIPLATTAAALQAFLGGQDGTLGIAER